MHLYIHYTRKNMEDSFYKDSLILLEGAITNITSKLEIIRKYKIIKV